MFKKYKYLPLNLYCATRLRCTIMILKHSPPSPHKPKYYKELISLVYLNLPFSIKIITKINKNMEYKKADSDSLLTLTI